MQNKYLSPLFVFLLSWNYAASLSEFESKFFQTFLIQYHRQMELVLMAHHQQGA